jgi:hypothetical protein
MIKAGAIEYAMEHINEIPSKVDVAKDNNTVPCICDCTQDSIKGKYSSDAGSKTCAQLCETYDEENDKTTDGAYKMTSKSGLTECVEPNKYCKIVSVNDLIVRGYVVGDRENKEVLENPFSEEPLNTSQVCIRYTNNSAYNRRLIAYIIGEGNLGK